MTETKKPSQADQLASILAKLESLEKRITGLEASVKRGHRAGAAKFGQIKEAPFCARCDGPDTDGGHLPGCEPAKQ